VRFFYLNIIYYDALKQQLENVISETESFGPRNKRGREAFECMSIANYKLRLFVAKRLTLVIYML